MTTARRIAFTVTALAAFGRWPLAWALQLVNDRGIRHRSRVEHALRDAGGCVDLVRRPARGPCQHCYVAENAWCADDCPVLDRMDWR